MEDRTIDRLAFVMLYRWQLKGLVSALTEHHFDATLIDAQSGFLRTGMATIIVGMAERRVPFFTSLLRDYCPGSTRYVPFEADMELPWYPESEMVEVRVGGAVAFIVPVERFVQL